jgi:putative methyltransferase
MSLYLEASQILQSTTGSLKSRIYDPQSQQTGLKSSPNRLYALTIETLKHQGILDEIIERSGILSLEKKVGWVFGFYKHLISIFFSLSSP